MEIRMHAYDIEVLPRAFDLSDTNDRGWCFGLPPGITPEQWPLDPANGYPLQHGFTLLLPEDYRCHGPDIVAVSFFASAIDHNDGGPLIEVPEIGEAMAAADAPSDPDLRPFWQAAQTAHPRLHRMEDILGIAFAAILLTQDEFDGPLCQPPRLTGNKYLDALPAPKWMAVGSAAAYWEFAGNMRVVQDTFGKKPSDDLAENRVIHWTPRDADPNGGRAPYDEFQHEPTDYVQPFFSATNADGKDQYQEHEWVAGLAANHIGGTMMPSQAVPEFSPYYIEFEEVFGGYNFGGGNAQLDVRDMKFDWACG
jgi:hypothetical protein